MHTGAMVCAVFAMGMFLCACSATGRGAGGSSTSQASKSIDPAGFSQSIQDARWSISAVDYEYSGDGFNYSSTKLKPVLLVFKNKGPGQPQVLLEDVRGQGVDSDFLVYSTDEAIRLAANSAGFKEGAKSILRGGGVGAAIGAGLGALVGLVVTGNPNAVWQGAVIGGAMGGVAGGVSGMGRSSQELRQALQTDLEGHAWHEDPITVGTTRQGYLFLPARQGITAVKFTVRSESGDVEYTLPIATAKDYDPNRAVGAAVVPSATPSPVKPAATPAPDDTPEPKRVPKVQVI